MQGATVKKLGFCVYLCLGHDFLHPYEDQKLALSTCVNYLWLISDFCQKKVFFTIVFWIFHFYNHKYLTNFIKSYSKMQIMDNQFILHSKSITELVCCQFFMVKGCFFKNSDFLVLMYQQIVQNIGSYREEAGILCIFVPWT